MNFAILLKAPWFLIFLSHFLFLVEARNKSIWFYTKFWFKQAPFLTSQITSFLMRCKPVQRNYGHGFSKILNLSCIILSNGITYFKNLAIKTCLETVRIVYWRYPTIAPEENCPPVKVRVWIRIRVSFRVRGQFSSGAIVLEPLLT